MAKIGIPTIIFSLCITVGLYLMSRSGLESVYARPFLTLSQITALLGTAFLSQTYILATRSSLVERLFGGLDKVFRVHQVIGALAFMFLLYHPLFLILNVLPNFRAALLYILPSTNIAYSTGIAALGILILLLALTLYIDMPYHIWKKTHDFMGWVIFLGLFHVFLIPSDVSRYMPLRVWMLGLLMSGFSAFVYKRFLYKYFGPNHKYKVAQVTRLHDDIVELRLTPVAGKLRFVPGQFVFVSLTNNPRVSSEEHPFSISSHPAEDQLRISAKIAGDYTLAMRDIEAGNEVLICGPYGAFGDRQYSKKPLVCVAGGIGITPVLSVAREAARVRAIDQTTHIIYATRSEEEAVYHDELANLCREHPGMCYIRHVSGKQGRLSADLLKSYIPNLLSSLILLCGPPAMMKNLSLQLVEQGVKRKNIIYEDFSLK